MTLIVKLKMKRTKLLGKPYIHCSKDTDANYCANKMTELEIVQKCNCYYGLITDRINRDGIRTGFKISYLRTRNHFIENHMERDCTYIDMVSCGNAIVQNFLFGRNEAVENLCPPSCETDSFFVDSVMVRTVKML